MRRFIFTAAATLAAAAFLAQGAIAPVRPPQGLAEALRGRVEAGEALRELVACGDFVYCSDALPEFYERRGFRPVWVGADGPTPLADSLAAAIAAADADGLTPGDYHLDVIRDLLGKLRRGNRLRAGGGLPSRGRPSSGGGKTPGLRSPLHGGPAPGDGRTSGTRPERGGVTGMLVDLDLLLTDSFLIYGSHLLGGRVDPQRIDPEWHAVKRERDMAVELEKAIESGRPAKTLRDLLPLQEGYSKLKSTLRHYREISAAGGWPEIGGRRKLRKGSRGPEVASLRTRLLAGGDLKKLALDGAGVYDDALERAVMRFQRRHGLDADGVVGPATRVALNVPVEDRIEQIEINMERFRWLPQDLGPHHIEVNIADFELDVVEDGSRVLNMRVVVGRDYRRTPVFSDAITYIVMNPRWNVPQTIALEDIIPRAQEDPSYLADNSIKVWEGWGAGAAELDARSIDWSSVDTARFEYRFTQEPGPRNALGRIKFMFPNEFQVYLHDTPAKDLFNRTERTFSSGCIRVEKPVDLAEHLLRGAGWTRERIVATMKEHEEKTVYLPGPVPIHILYWTAFVKDDGAINFRKDIYSRDRRLMSALRRSPPRPGGAHEHPLSN